MSEKYSSNPPGIARKIAVREISAGSVGHGAELPEGLMHGAKSVWELVNANRSLQLFDENDPEELEKIM